MPSPALFLLGCVPWWEWRWGRDCMVVTACAPRDGEQSSAQWRGDGAHSVPFWITDDLGRKNHLL